MALAARRLLLLMAFLAGGIAGFTGRRHEERVPLPPSRQRVPTLQEALWAYETGDPAAARSALASFRALGEAPREDVAEAALLGGLLDGGDDAALGRVQETWPATHAAARAAWERVLRAGTPAARQAARRAFAEAYPEAWVLGPPPVRAGP